MDLQQLLNPKQKLQEENPYTIQKLSIQIESQKENFQFNKGTLSIFNDYFQFILCEESFIQSMAESLKIVYVSFSNVSSVGTSGQNLCIFLQSENQEQSLCIQEIQGQQKSETDSIISLIKESKAGHFNVSGNLTIKIGFKNYNKSVLGQVHDILVQKLQSVEDSQEQENDMLGQMINADSINQDGTINFNKMIQQQKDYQKENKSESQSQQQEIQKQKKID